MSENEVLAWRFLAIPPAQKRHETRGSILRNPIKPKVRPLDKVVVANLASWDLGHRKARVRSDYALNDVEDLGESPTTRATRPLSIR